MANMKIQRQGIGNYASGQNPYNNNPDVTQEIQSTLSRLLGFDISAEAWRDLLVDSDGRLLVSTAPTISSSINQFATTVGLVSGILIAENVNRKSILIQNLGTVPIYIEYDASASLVGGIRIPVDGSYFENAYIGQISAISTVAAQDVRVLEL